MSSDIQKATDLIAQQADSIESLRAEVSDVREQLDFTERMLTQQRQKGQLPGVASEEG